MKQQITGWLVASLLAAVVAGCGGVSGSDTTAGSVAKSTSCFSPSHVGSCHQASLSPGTQVPIVAEWQKSVHFTSNAAGCVDCHETDSNHYCAKCHTVSSRQPVGNPDAAGKCGKCHGLAHPEDRMIVKAPQHFGNMTASQNNSTYRASYVSANYVGNCRKCHNPHDPTTAFDYSVNWASSGHGDTLANARVNFDAKFRGSPVSAALSYGNSQSATLFPNLPDQRIYCVRCHTTTGYINYVSSGFTNVSPFPFAVNSEKDPETVGFKTKEVTNCNACHDDGNGTAYSWKLRKVPQVTVYYNHRNVTFPNNIDITNNATQFPDAGSSNMCIPCHAARQNGNVIKLIANGAQGAFANITSISRVSSHDLGGAASLFKQIGYEFEDLDYTNKPTYRHEDIGMATGGATPKGPCITCHLNMAVKAESHGFLPVTEVPDPTVKSASLATIITGVISKTCATAGCHVASTPNIPWTTVEELEAKKAGFYAAMQGLLEFQAIAGTVTRIDRTRTPHAPTYTIKWDRLRINGVPVTLAASAGHTFPWADNMGATFNYDALKNDPGAFAHNDVYTKRLIFDSLNWLMQTDPTITTVAQALDRLAAGTYNARTFVGAATTPINSSNFFTATMATNAKAWLGGGITRP
ncbi:MAG TPA: cytochrome C [Geobacteraceae bacterium]